MTLDLDISAQHLLRDLAPQVLGLLVRRYRDFPGCEDAVQEALIAATRQWPDEGVPENARGWLLKVATRRLTDQVRADTARRLREQLVVSLVPMDEQIALAADALGASDHDDTLDLYFMCCHPALTTSSQVALTLRAVGGLATTDIARAFQVPEKTMAQRLSRAKATIKASGTMFPAPDTGDRAKRLPAVMQVLYLAFNAGYTASSGDALLRLDLSSEAIRVTRLLNVVLPGHAEAMGLLALMLLTDARRKARTGSNGELVPLDEQDRTRWDRVSIDEGTTMLRRALALGVPGPYQVQASIAALHDAATNTDDTDWPQILTLYQLLLQMTDTPMARLSHAIALAMVQGPASGILALDAMATDPSWPDRYRVDAARAHLLERAGEIEGAITHYRRASSATASTPERNYLMLRAARLAESREAPSHRGANDRALEADGDGQPLSGHGSTLPRP